MNFKQQNDQKHLAGKTQINSNFYVRSNYSSQNNSLLSNLQKKSQDTQKQLLQKAIQFKNTHINQLIQELRQAKQLYQQYKAKITKQNQNIRQKNSELLQAMQKIQRQNQHLKRQVKNLSEENDFCKEQIPKIKDSNNEYEKELRTKLKLLNEQNLDLVDNYKSLKLKNENLQLQKKEEAEKVLRLKEEVQSLKLNLITLNKEGNDNLQKAIKQNKLLSKQLQTLKAKKKNHEKYQKKLQSLQDKITNIMVNI